MLIIFNQNRTFRVAVGEDGSRGRPHSGVLSNPAARYAREVLA